VELKGTGVSPGIAMGPALVVERDAAPVFRVSLAPDAVPAELQRFETALAQSRAQLQAVKERLSREVGALHAYIFDAHLLMLDDPLLLEKTRAVIRGERVNAEWALREVAEQLHAMFDGFSDAYLRERSTDLDDVLGRIQLNLRGSADAPSLARLPGSFVLVAADLLPSEAAELDWEKVLAVATDVGSSTYHTAIIARSLGIPAVVGLKDATSTVKPGAMVVVDGTRGAVVVEPTAPALAGFRTVQEEYRHEEERLQGTRALPAVTTDGVAVVLRANVEFPDEAATAAVYGAEGIGLFRSEYLLGRGLKWPSEDQQVDVYRRLLEQMRPYPVTVRTWDVGQEEFVPGGPSSPNPALGERALRLIRRAPDPFRVQLRALLRAGRQGPLRILFPFAAGFADLRLALDLVQEAREELRREGVEFREDVPVGLNLEVPGAALVADLLAPEVEFFSVGTNDLVQYLLAADRNDPRVAGSYEPLHPAVLRTLAQVVAAAEGHRVPLSVCGEMAAEPLKALLLVGLGFRELSMTPAAIPRVKAAVRSARADRAREIARRCLTLRTASEIEALLGRELVPSLEAADFSRD
jgi:phosphoenolpyruvate-protein phosphotransferase (PTS system enzyme I)